MIKFEMFRGRTPKYFVKEVAEGEMCTNAFFGYKRFRYIVGNTKHTYLRYSLNLVLVCFSVQIFIEKPMVAYEMVIRNSEGGGCEVRVDFGEGREYMSIRRELDQDIVSILVQSASKVICMVDHLGYEEYARRTIELDNMGVPMIRYYDVEKFVKKYKDFQPIYKILKD